MAKKVAEEMTNTFEQIKANAEKRKASAVKMIEKSLKEKDAEKRDLGLSLGCSEYMEAEDFLNELIFMQEADFSEASDEYEDEGEGEDWDDEETVETEHGTATVKTSLTVKIKDAGENEWRDVELNEAQKKTLEKMIEKGMSDADIENYVDSIISPEDHLKEKDFEKLADLIKEKHPKSTSELMSMLEEMLGM